MTKLRRFIVPPIVVTLIALIFLSGTALGKHFLFKVTDLLLFRGMTEDLIALTMSPSRWLYLGVHFVVLLGIFSVLWGILTYLSWEQTVKRLPESGPARDGAIAEKEKNGMSAWEIAEGFATTTIGEFLLGLFAGAFLVFFVLAFGVIAFLLIVLLPFLLLGLFVEISPINSSVLLFCASLFFGVVCAILGYGMSSSTPDEKDTAY